MMSILALTSVITAFMDTSSMITILFLLPLAHSCCTRSTNSNTLGKPVIPDAIARRALETEWCVERSGDVHPKP